jgi:hypothetical protein
MRTKKTRTSTTRKKRTKRKRTSLTRRAAFAVLAGVFLLGFSTSGKSKKKVQETPEAVIAGTVFRPPGLALPGAEVIVTPLDVEKPKKLKTVTNFRGEFAVRVPAVPMKYSVDVKAEGFKPDQKTAAIEGEQRRDLSFLLDPAK